MYVLGWEAAAAGAGAGVEYGSYEGIESIDGIGAGFPPVGLPCGLYAGIESIDGIPPIAGAGAATSGSGSGIGLP